MIDRYKETDRYIDRATKTYTHETGRQTEIWI